MSSYVFFPRDKSSPFQGVVRRRLLQSLAIFSERHELPLSVGINKLSPLAEKRFACSAHIVEFGLGVGLEPSIVGDSSEAVWVPAGPAMST